MAVNIMRFFMSEITPIPDRTNARVSGVRMHLPKNDILTQIYNSIERLSSLEDSRGQPKRNVRI